MEDHLWKFDYRNPTSWGNIIPQNHTYNSENNHHLSQNHHLLPQYQNLVYQNPNPQQNPISQNHHHQQIFHYGSGFDDETCFSLLTPPRPSPQSQFLGNNNIGFSYPLDQNQVNNDDLLLQSLERLRIDSAVRGQTQSGGGGGLYTRPNHQYRGGSINLARSSSSNVELSLPYLNSTRLDQVQGRSVSNLPFSLSSSPLYTNNNNNNAIRVKPPRRGLSLSYSYSSLEELKGRVSSVAKDQQGCRFLQKKVSEQNPMDIEMIFSEIEGDLHELMVHQFANYLVQKLVPVLNEKQMTKFIVSVTTSDKRLFKICDDVHGTRVMQKLIDPSDMVSPRNSLTLEQKSLLVSALKNIAVDLSKSLNGHHVIQQCLRKFSSEYTKDLVEEVVVNSLDLATNKSGCCVLQTCIVHAQEEHKGRLISDIVANSLVLSEHEYGNYVVQYLLEFKIPQVTNGILAQLAGNYCTLAKEKCGSNVVEKCLKETGDEYINNIVKEITHHPDFLDVVQSPYGNYVIQTAMKFSKGRVQHILLDLILMNHRSLQSHIHGKRVLGVARRSRCHI